MRRYQDIYPSAPILMSDGSVRPSAAELLSLEYFEAEPASMPHEVFSQHHILINLKAEPHRVENWRGEEHRDFTFRKNEVIVTPSGIKSGWRWHEHSRCIVITLDPAMLEAFTQNELGKVLTHQQLVDTPQFEDADLTAAATMLYEALRQSSSGSQIMFESLARIFLVKLVERYGDEQSEELAFSRAFTPAHYKRVLDFVSQRFGDAISIEDIAREAGLSASHFTRLFKRTVGDTPHQFLMRYRVEQAAKMLADKSKAAIEVAHACGFSDQPHMSRVFKQYRGETPSAWQRRHA
ncbi:helix-turn-helix domain-containing protein [Erythrobacter sp. KMU-140]|uniref:Helix-turn-helix domain-containing protein n=2 Tax=Erythrobacter rubeus TaxID=2760803 RepID=A0ABR8KV69_9SPHN|nr:helix-turn-helix domain-containing protein [Erythrobacter rubeus]